VRSKSIKFSNQRDSSHSAKYYLKQIHIYLRNNKNNKLSSRMAATSATTLYKTVVQSAVVIMPPEDLWPSIQEIRKVHDKAYERWPPHINMLYPFVESQNFPACVVPIQLALSSIQPFKLTFEHFRNFGHGTMYLQPKTAANNVHVVQSALEDCFPYCNDLSKKSKGGFTPHLSVGQFPKNELQKTTATFQSTWKPIEFTVSEVCLISRSGFADPFKVIFKIPLGTPVDSKSKIEPIIAIVASPPKEIDPPKHKVFVGNLPFITEEKDLHSFFVHHGIPVVEVTIVSGRNGESKGFGFVQLESEELFQKALQTLDQKELQGRLITVKPAK